MRRGRIIIPGGLLMTLLAAGVVMALDAPCPTTNNAVRPRLFLQTDNLKALSLAHLGDDLERPKTYQFDPSLIDGNASVNPAKTTASAVELIAETDLAAVRIRTEGAITPYVGAGVSATPEPEATPGISEFEAEREAERQSYLIGAGLACDISHTARLNLGYRFATGNVTELSGARLDNEETDREGHHISFGLKLDF